MTIEFGMYNPIHQDINNYLLSHPWEDERMEQVQPEKGFFNELSSQTGWGQGGFFKKVDSVKNDPFAVNTVEEMQRNIERIQNNIQIRQNMAFQAGKCLRSLAIGIKGTISKTGCRVAQIVDKAMAAEFFKFVKYQRCDEGEDSTFCRSVDYIRGLQASDVAQENIFLAQIRVADINGLERTELFKP